MKVNTQLYVLAPKLKLTLACRCNTFSKLLLFALDLAIESKRKKIQQKSKVIERFLGFFFNAFYVLVENNCILETVANQKM